MNPLKQALPVEIGQRYFIEAVPFSTALGLRFVSNHPAHLTFDLPWCENLVGDVASGALDSSVLTAMVDTVCGGVVQTRTSEPRRVVTLDLRVDYLRSAHYGDTHASAELIRIGKTTCSMRVVAWQADPTKPVAAARVQFLLKDR